MDYEGALLSKILRDDVLGEVLDCRVKDELFVSHSEAWKYIIEVYSEHGGLPPVEMVENKFPQYAYSDHSDTPVTYLVDEMKKRHLHNLMTEGLRKQADLLKAKDPKAALEIMRDMIMQADEDLRPSHDVNLIEDQADRVKRYEEAAMADGGVTGIPSPWPCLDDVTQGFHPEDLIMIAGRGGIGKCLDAASMVVDPITGIERTIQEVVEGDQKSILTWDAEKGIVSEDITHKIDTGRKQCLTYRLHTGREIVVTPEHPFLTPEGWRRADELDAGSYVGLPESIPAPIEPKHMLEEDLLFLALLLSEGTYTGHHVGFSTEDLRMVEIAERFVAGTPAKVVHRGGVDYDISVGMVGGHTLNPARTLLRGLGIDNKLAKEKTIPKEVYQLDDNQLAAFLTVFWMADGYVDNGAPGVVLASKKMVLQIQHLLLRFGIQSSVNYKPVKGGFNSWRLRIYSKYIESFNHIFHLWGPRRSGSKRVF